jgi:hypothetical protein
VHILWKKKGKEWAGWALPRPFLYLQLFFTIKNKGKEELHNFCQNGNRERGKSYSERHYRNGSCPWFREIKMNLRAFVSINRMTAGPSSLKATLSRVSIVPAAECECGDGLQT